MSDQTSTTAAKASGITPTTALPDANTSNKDSSKAKKSNLPASNPVPLPESPAIVNSDSEYPPAEPAYRQPAPTATATTGTTNNVAMSPSGHLSSLDDDTTPTKTTTNTVNLTDPPAPQAGSFPTPTAGVHKSSQSASEPQPGATPSVPSSTSAAAATTTSMPGPSFTMPPVQTTYGPPEVTARGQPMAGYTSTATSTSYENFPSAVRRSSEVAPLPGGYQQRGSIDRPLSSEEAGREDGILGKVSQAVDKFNEWMVGDKGGTSGV